ncbi:MAG: hypothetical protein AAF664_23975 [Planctomycetota bacterium]
MLNQPRRQFIKTAAAAAIATPAIMTAKRTLAQEVIGDGDQKYRCIHAFPELPDQYRWQTTHNVAVDPNNRLYVIHEGHIDKPSHPCIFVFDEEGKFVRAFGEMFQGGGHGLDIRVEEGTPYLYVSAYQNVKTIAKMTLDGQLIWQKYAPMETGVYAEGEAAYPQKTWGRDRYMPTNFGFLPDGGFLVADGYGSWTIHRYDSDGNFVDFFGGPGEGQGTFNLPHGIWVDTRGDKDQVVVADRAHNTLQVFDLEGSYQKTVTGFGLPANIDTYQDLMVVPELVARLSLIDSNHNTILTLGDDRERVLKDKEENKGFTIRTDEKQWQQGKFVHPHDACFDNEGAIYVAEWVSTGRVSKLIPA